MTAPQIGRVIYVCKDCSWYIGSSSESADMHEKVYGHKVKWKVDEDWKVNAN